MFITTEHRPIGVPGQGVVIGSSHRNNRWLPFPIHLLYLLFLIMLLIKLQFSSDIPWISVFIFLFTADLLNMIAKSYNLSKEWRARNTVDTSNRENLFRVISSVVDAVGGFFGKFGVFIYIELRSKHMYMSSLTLIKTLIPLFIMVIISVCFKLYSGPPRLFGGPLLTNNTTRWTSLIHPLLIFSYRGLQPLLIALQVDGVMHAKWSLVFIPLWIMIFGGIAMSIVLITCAPYVHRTAPLPIRESAFALVFLYATQVLFSSTCVLIFLIYLVQDLDFIYGYHDGKSVDVTKILAPLMVLFTLLILSHPLILMTVDRYQISLALMIQVHSNIAMLLASNLTMRQEAVLEETNERTWLMQLNSTLYRKLAFDTSSVSNDYTALPINADASASHHDYHSTGHTIPIYAHARDYHHINIESNELGIVDGSHVDGDLEDDAINLIRVCSDAYVHRSDEHTHRHNPTHPAPPNTYRSQSPGDIEMATSAAASHRQTTSSDSRIIPMPDDELLRNELSALTASLPPVQLPHQSVSSTATPTTNADITTSCLPVAPDIMPSSDGDSCVVCYAQEADAVLLACGHAVLCWACAQLIAKAPRSQCPVCRLPIDQFLRISTTATYPLHDGRIVALSDHGYRVVLRALPRRPPNIEALVAMLQTQDTTATTTGHVQGQEPIQPNATSEQGVALQTPIIR